MVKSYCNLAARYFSEQKWPQAIAYCEPALNKVAKEIKKHKHSIFSLKYLLMEQQHLLKLRESANEHCEQLRKNTCLAENTSLKRFNLC